MTTQSKYHFQTSTLVDDKFYFYGVKSTEVIATGPMDKEAVFEALRGVHYFDDELGWIKVETLYNGNIGLSFGMCDDKGNFTALRVSEMDYWQYLTHFYSTQIDIILADFQDKRMVAKSNIK